MTSSRRARGMRTQLLVAELMRTRGWPHATSAGSGRAGVDILETLDVAVEVKARAGLDPLAWLRQAEKAADGRLPLVVFRPNGLGEHPEEFVAFLRFGDLLDLLAAAGYGDHPDGGGQ